jgi:acetyl esterase
MKKHKVKHFFFIGVSSIAVVAFLVFLAFRFTPWPTAMLIRYAFNKDGKIVNELLKKHLPEGVSVIPDEQYIQGDDDAKLDVYYPTAISKTNQALPVIIWVHGGGWVAGSKDQLGSYSRILASKGFCVIAIDYSLAPEKTYPTPLLQTNKALAYIAENSKRFYADTSNIVLAGDSGGAHIVAQTANMISDSSYAKLVGIEPNIGRNQLSGLILYCGPYDSESISTDGDFSTFIKTVLWSYSGKKDYKSVPGFKAVSVVNYVTSKYPPCFISAGNGDPLLPQSQALARKLNKLNVMVDTLFFKADLNPRLPHEYQFNLEDPAGKLALKNSLIFLKGLHHESFGKSPLVP